MSYQITIEEKALKQIEYFKKHNRLIANKIYDLMSDLKHHPFNGIGKAEPLKFELSGCWSKRISKEHRLIYQVKNDMITIISCRFHY